METDVTGEVGEQDVDEVVATPKRMKLFEPLGLGRRIAEKLSAEDGELEVVVG